MKVLVINLDCETARMAFQREQAMRFGFDIERLSAFTPDTLDPPAGDPFWARWQRPLRDVEKAALLSHRAAWQRVAAGSEPILVLEDDAWLMPATTSLLRAAATLEGVEHLSLETRGRRKLMGARHTDLAAVRQLWLDRSGAAAYLLWPAGAARLLARADRVAGLADAVPVETPGLKRWQADPAIAIQLDMAAHYGLTPPLVTQSAILTVDRPLRQGAHFRARRIWRQLVMGMISLRHPRAVRQEPELQT